MELENNLTRMDLYKKTVEYVNSAFEGKNVKHFERTVYWIEKFIPNTTEAQKIAAYSHDIERGVMKGRFRDYLNGDFLKQHMDDGARIMGDFLKSNGADDTVIQEVKHLISKHEFGGDAEQNTIMDADSVSYLETNAEMFVTKRVKEDGYQKVKDKLDWMYNRISTKERKSLAKENYDKWSKILEVNK